MWESKDYDTPLERNALVEIAFRPPWFTVLDAAVSNLMLALTWLALFGCSVGHHYKIGERLLEEMGNGIDDWLSAGRVVAVAGFAGHAVCILVVVGGSTHNGSSNVQEYSIHALAACMLAVCVVAFPRKLIEAISCYSAIKLMLLIVSVASKSWSVTIEQGAPQVVAILCCIFLFVQHSRSKRISQLKVAEDVAGYERVWEEICNDPEEISGIELLNEIEVRILERIPAHAQNRHQRFRPMSRALCGGTDERRRQQIQNARRRLVHGSFKSRLLTWWPRTSGRFSGKSRNFSSWDGRLPSGASKRNSWTDRTPWMDGSIRAHHVRAKRTSSEGEAAVELENQRSSPMLIGTESRVNSVASREPSGDSAKHPGPVDDDAGGVFPASSQAALQNGQPRPRGLSCSASLVSLPADLDLPGVVQRGVVLPPLPQRTPSADAIPQRTPSAGALPQRTPSADQSPSSRGGDTLFKHMVRSQLSKAQALPGSAIGQHILPSVPSASSPTPIVPGLARYGSCPEVRRDSNHSLSPEGGTSPDEVPAAKGGMAAGVPARHPRARGLSPLRLSSMPERDKSPGSGPSPMVRSLCRRTPSHESLQARGSLQRLEQRSSVGSGAGSIAPRRPLTRLQSRSSIGKPGPAQGMQMLRRVASSIHRLASNHVTNLKLKRFDDEGERVESLSQLYAQATVLHPILMKKVQRWAAFSDGLCTLKDVSGKLVEWQYLVDRFGEEAAEQKVKWAGVKSISRAEEKLVRSYEGRPSRLLDVCRQSIIFKSTVSLASCVERIAEDPEVEVVLIKNRLHDAYDARARTLGYRDVNLNIRLHSAKTRILGVDLHICEVQLLLEPFAKLKSEDGHKRYKQWRNDTAR